MSLCQWRDAAELPLVCEVCLKPCRLCQDEQTERTCIAGPPSKLRRAANFVKAAVKHELRGRPTVNQATIDARFAICEACQLFLANRGICGHKKCGCNVNTDAKFLNKLAWADQKCPDGRW